MVHLDASLAEQAESGEKGLKEGALGFVSSVVVGVASTAPAYSLAATLGFVVIAINGLQAPIITIIAFVPMLFISYGYKALNSADPDCGTTFTWGARAFGPKTGWWGGWGIVAADILVMASLAQIAGQYVFLLFGANGIGQNPNSGWVLLVGVMWIVAMTAICYVGIEISANFQKALLGIEITMLLVLSVVALYKVGAGTAPVGHLTPAWSWFNPFAVPNPESFLVGFTLMLFIYWGWDTAVSVNEETKERDKIPGRAAVTSTLILLVTYAVVDHRHAVLRRDRHARDRPGEPQPRRRRALGARSSIFGTSGFGSFLSKLLLLMVLSSAAASTQTTILPTARTTLSMAVFKAIPNSFSKIHKRFLTPTVSTLAMGGVSIVLYVVLNSVSNGNAVIEDSVSAIGVWIAFYYGLTGLSCFWYYRSTLGESAKTLWLRGILPLVGWAMLLVRHVLGVLVLLAPRQLLHVLDGAGHPLGDRRRVPARRRRRPPRDHPHGRLRPDAPGVLPRRGPQPRHPDPGAGRPGCAGRPVRDRGVRRDDERQRRRHRQGADRGTVVPGPSPPTPERDAGAFH